MNKQIYLALMLFSAIVIAAFVIRWAYRLWQKYRLLFLGSFLFYLLAWNLNGILGLLTFAVVPLVIPTPALAAVFLINSMIFIPLHGLVAFFFLDFVFRLLHRSLPRFFKAGFLALFFLYFAVVLIRDLIVFSPLRSRGPMVISAYSLAAMAACLFAALIFLQRVSKKSKNAETYRHILAFEWITALGFVCSFLLMMDIFPEIGAIGKNLAITTVVFGFNIPALAALGCAVRSEYGLRPSVKLDEAGFAGFCRNFDLSQRESEVLKRVMKGKSNREIEMELFISLDTVKKHLYNIFRKTGVKSRVRLIYLVSNQLSKPAPAADEKES
jgi:DNA-binding CsgD family transcriptional regulator